MKKLLVLLFVNVICYSQTSIEKFEYTELGLNDYVVSEFNSVSKDEIYKKTINWVKETYKNPDEVLKMKIENEKIRINGIANKLLNVKGYTYNLEYVIDISFKDNKYKFELISLTYEQVDYKKIPNFKTDKKMIKYYGKIPYDIEDYFNKLNLSLKYYVNGISEDKW
jgi:hypothetical protein